MPYINYEYDPNNPESKYEARQKAYWEFILGNTLILGLIGCIIYYICSLVSCINGDYSANIFYSFGLIFILSVGVFHVLTIGCDKYSKKEFACKYFVFFFGGILEFSAIISIIVSICYYEQHGGDLFVFSVLAALIIAICIELMNKILVEKKSFKLFTQKELSQTILSEANKKDDDHTDTNTERKENIYCHKCGKCLPKENVFCSFCGTKLQ